MKTRSATISVVIPAYNVGKFLSESIDSALSQRTEGVEVIVINDGSTDETADVMHRYGSRIRSIHKENQGVASARNMGLKNASGEFIAFLDGDDIWKPNNLKIKTAFLRQNPDIEGVFGDFEIFDSGDTLKESGIKHLYPIFRRNDWDVSDVFGGCNVLRVEPDVQLRTYVGNIFAKLFYGNFILTSTLVLRRSILDEIGIFDERFNTNEDYDFFLRLAGANLLGFVDVPLVRYRRHETQLTSRRNIVSVLRAVEKILAKYEQQFDAKGDVLSYKKRHAQVLTELAKAELAVGRRKIARQRFAEAVRENGLSIQRVGGLVFSVLPRRIQKLLLDNR